LPARRRAVRGERRVREQARVGPPGARHPGPGRAGQLRAAAPSARPARRAIQARPSHGRSGPHERAGGHVPALITRMRELAGRAGRSVWTSPTLALMLLASAALSRVEPGYNHMVGAYALVGLVALNLNSWTGRATESDLALPVSFLAAAAWIWWYGHADVVPYLALATVGLEPTSGRARRVAATRGGYTPARAALLAASLVIAALLAPRLVFTRARVDLTIPKPYSLPRDLLQQRRAELEAYVARPAGSRDAAALTELGFVLHDLGLSDRSQLPRAEAALRRALSLDPGRAEAVAWYGSTLAAQALHEKRPVPRMRLAADGLAA